jgi:uncharacterized protein
MEFEWDETKRADNLQKHGVDFLDAALMFEGWVLRDADTRFEYGEVRWKVTGLSDGIFIVMIVTIRGTKTRIISAWKGSKNDRRNYEARFAARTPADEERW